MSLQNKKRKYDRDRDEREERERTPEQTEDPLKDAATLYVGNLSVDPKYICMRMFVKLTSNQVFLYNRRANS